MAGWYVTSTPGAEFGYHATSAAWIQAEIVSALCGTDHVAGIHALVTEPLGLPSFYGIDDTHADVADLVPVATGAATIDMGEATFDALLRFNDHDVRLVGVPGAGAYATAADVALLYQGVMQNPGGLSDPAVLADGIGTVRVTEDDPMRMAPANRSRGFMIAGDDGHALRRGFAVDAGPRTFGHDGAGGQVAWADPDIVRLTRRSVSVSTRAMRSLRL